MIIQRALRPSKLGFLPLVALKAGNRDLDGSCNEAQQADFPAALQAVMLGDLPRDDDANEDGERQDQFVHRVFQQAAKGSSEYAVHPAGMPRS